MAKVKILESCAGLDFSYSINEEVEENEHTQGLINGGLAEWVEKPAPVAAEDETSKVETKKSAPKKDK